MNTWKSLQIAGFTVMLVIPVARANLTFNLIPDPGMPQFAIDGFTTAANLWSSAIADNVTVNVQIGYAALGPGVIGQAGSAFYETSYSSVGTALGAHATSPDDFSSVAALQSGPSFSRLINHTSNNPDGANSSTPYVDTMDRVGMTTANAKVLGLVSPSGEVDALIRFSSNFAFDFNHGPVIDPGKIDFIGAAAHEIGHALGFVSGVDDIDSFSGTSPGFAFSDNMVDLFRYSEMSLNMGAGITDYTADTRDKFFSVDGGLTSIALFSTGFTFGDGRQASHWKDGLELGLMDPTVAFGERMDFTLNDYRLFDVIGYTLVPEPGTGVILVLGMMLIMARHRASTER